MLQIIGWLGCLMLAVKLVEMHYNSTLRDAEGEMPDNLSNAIFIGWLGVGAFALLLLFIGMRVQDLLRG